MSFLKTLIFHSDKWNNPEESIGELVGVFHGCFMCWEAIGKARRVFEELSPEIKGYLEASSIPPSDTISWSIFMVGCTEEMAAPKVLICSTNLKAGKNIRKLIKDSNIMAKYPGVGLGDVSVLPDRQVIKTLSREAIQSLIPPDCDINGAALVEESESLLGARLYTIEPKDLSLRPAIAGPIIIQDGKHLLLTVAHVFQHGSESGDLIGHGIAADDCDFDGMSDDEGDDDSQENDIGRRGSATPEEMDSQKGSFTAKLDDSVETVDNIWFDNLSRNLPSHRLDSGHSIQHAPKQRPGDLDMCKLRYFGSLTLTSMMGNNPSLDYALIEVHPGIIADIKSGILINRTMGSPVISAIGKIESADVRVVATTLRYLATGNITATPTYMRLPGQDGFSKVLLCTVG